MRIPIRKLTRFAWFSLIFLGTAILTTSAVLLALDRGGHSYKQVNLEPLRFLSQRLSKTEADETGVYRVVFLGDSLSIGPGGFTGGQQIVPNQLKHLIQPRIRPRRELEIVPVIWSGLSIFSYYFMSEPIVDVNPDDVVVQFDLFWLSESWHRDLDRTVLAALLPFSRWREVVTLPLHVSSLTADRWILYRSLSELGLIDMWYPAQREQARMPGAYWNLLERAQRSLANQEGLGFRGVHGLLWRGARVDERGRATELAARELFGPALDGIAEDHFALAMLDALLSRFEDAGIPALVYVPPHNVDNLERLGLLNRDGLDRTLAQIEAVVHSRGGRFVDLHDLFPDEAFRDYLDHYVDEPGKPGSRLIARELAPDIYRRYQIRQRTGR